MARPRTPKAKAAVTGRDQHDGKRFKSRKEPQGIPPLGKPPKWIKDVDCNKALTAWNEFAKDYPWLNDSHRTHLVIACNIYGRVIADQDVGVQALNLLRQCVGQMGGNPSDATKVTLPNDDEDEDDDLDD